MPLDVLFEIFTHMHPAELLNLSRSCKDFRGLLMTRTAAPFWKAARRNVDGLPDCPPFMSEPAYANLCFNNQCYRCFKPCQMIYWTLRVRLCNACRWMVMCTTTSQLVPVKPVVFKGRCYMGPMCVEAELNAIIVARSAYTTPEEIAEFEQRQRNFVVEVNKFADRGRRWEIDIKDARTEEIDIGKKARLEAITARLISLGWEEELGFMKKDYHSPQLSKLPIVNQPGELTDRAWQKTGPKVIKFMEERKAVRLREARITVLAVRARHLQRMREELCKSDFPIAPSALTMAGLPEIVGLFDAPNDAPDQTSEFNNIQLKLPVILSHWAENARIRLRDHFKQVLGLPRESSDSPLAIASFYHCRHCRQVCSEDDVMKHSCRRLSMREDRDVMPPLEYVFHDEIHFNPASYFLEVELIKPIIVACGQDPNKVTVADMDKLDVKLTCLMECCTAPGVRSVMSWRTAVLHNISNAKVPPEEGKWIQATSYDNEAVTRSETLYSKSWPPTFYGYYCVSCRFNSDIKDYRSGGIHMARAETLSHSEAVHSHIPNHHSGGLRLERSNSLRVPYVIKKDADWKGGSIILTVLIHRAVDDGTVIYEAD